MGALQNAVLAPQYQTGRRGTCAQEGKPRAQVRAAEVFTQLAQHAELAKLVADASLPALAKLVEVSIVIKALLLSACWLLLGPQDACRASAFVQFLCNGSCCVATVRLPPAIAACCALQLQWTMHAKRWQHLWQLPRDWYLQLQNMPAIAISKLYSQLTCIRQPYIRIYARPAFPKSLGTTWSGSHFASQALITASHCAQIRASRSQRL